MVQTAQKYAMSVETMSGLKTDRCIRRLLTKLYTEGRKPTG